MKAYMALALVALLNTEQDVNAVKIQQQAAFVDDIVKALAEAEKADEAKPAEPSTEKKAAPEKKPEPKKAQEKTDKKEDAKKDEKKDDDVPMDNAAIKAYSSVIADAAEDSEPSTPVVFSEIKDVAPPDSRSAHAPAY